MPRKQKPSEWNPKGFDVSPEVRRLYPQNVLDSIIEQAGVHDRATRKRLRHAVSETVHWLYLDLHYQGRPSTVKKRASLDELMEQVERLRLTLRRLDSDTLKALETEADLDPVNPSTEPPRSIIKYQGDIRMAVIKRGLTPLSEWIRRARKTLSQAKSGRPKKKAELEAVCRLANAWAEAHGGTAPTRRYDWLENDREYGPFRKFANVALSPLKVPVSDRMVKKAIKLAKDKLKISKEK